MKKLEQRWRSQNGDNEFFVSFKDSSGKAVEVDAVGLPATRTMPSMDGDVHRNQHTRCV